MKSVLRWSLRIFLALVVIVAIGAFSLYWRIHASLPQTQGELELTGLHAPVKVERDQYGVPHVFAENFHDLYFAVGVLHAQDRLFQMDLSRRLARGQLSEVVGKAALKKDAQMRTLGLGAAADSSFQILDEDTKSLYRAYADGVNAVMKARGFVAPPEYVLLRKQPARWEPSDGVAVFKAVAYGLSGDAFSEPGRKRLKDILGAEKAREFQAPYPDYAPVALSDADLGLDKTPGDSAKTGQEPAEAHTLGEPPKGSNNWVVDGELSASGKPILANDPHLGLSAPGVWYFMRLQVGDKMVLGGTMPGVPFVILGRNPQVAWGFTNTGPDVADLIIANERDIVATTEEEVIKVGKKDVKIQIRHTSKGPILDSKWFNAAKMAGPGQVVIWEATLDDGNDTSAEIGRPLFDVENYQQYSDLMRKFLMPEQNMVFASRSGDIGFVSPGRVPIRDMNGEWTNYVPYEKMPHSLNTDRHYYATANNKIVPDDYPYYITNSWYGFHRAQRIVDMLNETELHDEHSFHRMQMDTTSVLAQRAIPLITAAQPQTDAGKNMRKTLSAWDGNLAADRVEGLYYSLWMREFTKAVYADDLGEDFKRFWSPRRQFMDGVLEGRYASWCNDVNTPEVETCQQIAAICLDRAAAEAKRRYGPDYAKLHWGDVHDAVFDHPIFGKTPLGRFFNVRVPVGGDGTTVNVAHASIDADNFDVVWGPSFRAIYDFADLNSSEFIFAPGQSGHVLSPHYRDLAGMWARGDYFELRADWDADSPPPGSQLLVLKPGTETSPKR